MENPFPAEQNVPEGDLPHEAAATKHEDTVHPREGESESAHQPKADHGQAERHANESLPHSDQLNEYAPREDHSPQTTPPTGESEEASNLTEGGNPANSQDQGDEESDSTSSLEKISDAEFTTPEPGSLEDFTNRARRARLNPEEEAETVRLLKESLLGGRTEVARAIAVTGSLPWVVSVQATTLAWPEIKASFRAQFLAGLARTQGESAARVRLSLARGLYKVDTTAAKKI
ncbi:MAG: hypothetical protein EBR81_10595, partial [Proteobacteria bacterium]|nr:hypothetical protein [Pseudomonadota bacterium]